MKAVVIGNGSREASIGESLSANECEIFGVSTTQDGYPLNIQGAEMLGKLPKNRGDLLGLLGYVKPHVVVIQQERLLFDGLANALRDSGLRVLGADCQPSMIEREKDQTRQIVRERLPDNVPSRIPAENPLEWLIANKTRCVVRAKTVTGPQTTVIVTDEKTRRHAAQLAKQHEVVIEEYVEGTGITFYALTNGKTTSVLPPVQTYPFRFDYEKGEKTGGMGVSTVRNLNPSQLCSASTIANQVADILAPKNINQGNRLQCFSIELLVGEQIMYLESDARLGDPENCLLTELMGRKSMGETLLSLVNDEVAIAPQKYNAGLGIVLVPNAYPHISTSDTVSTEWLGILQGRASHIYLGDIKIETGFAQTGNSRSLTYTRVGNDLGQTQKLAYSDLDHARIPGEIDFRRDIGQ